jgi:hypothetical protein
MIEVAPAGGQTAPSAPTGAPISITAERSMS